MSGRGRGDAPAGGAAPRRGGRVPVEREQWRLLLRNLPWAIAANAACGVFAAAIAWWRSGEAAAWLWLAAVLAVAAWRAGVLRRCRRAALARAGRRGARGWVLAGNAAGGLVWGLGALWLIPWGDLAMQLVFSFFAAGLAAGAVASLAPVLASFVAFAAAFLPVLAARLIVEQAFTQVVMGVATLVFLAVMLALARNANRQTAEGLRLRFANARLVRDLARARDHAEAANRAKSDFLAAMSHELRTPLNAVIGFSELIAAERLGRVGRAVYRDYARDIHDSGRYLLGLINDILDFSKFESGAMQLDPGPVDLAELAEASLAMLRLRADKQGVRLEARVAAGLPLIHADGQKLRQVLLNLLTNAVKFTPREGRVRLAVRRGPAGEVRLSVADSGLGMSPEEVEVAFTPFRQVRRGELGRHEGTGLGLPLARSLVELHGGTLEVDTAPGAGTTVTAVLPAHLAIEPAPPRAPAAGEAAAAF